MKMQRLDRMEMCTNDESNKCFIFLFWVYGWSNCNWRVDVPMKIIPEEIKKYIELQDGIPYARVTQQLKLFGEFGR